MELSSDFLEAQEIYIQILNFSDTAGGVRELGAPALGTSGRLPAEAMTRKEAGHWERSVWVQSALGTQATFQGSTFKTPDHTSSTANVWIHCFL